MPTNPKTRVAQGPEVAEVELAAVRISRRSSSDLITHMVLAGRRMQVRKPSRLFRDWDGVGFEDAGPFP